MRVTNKMLSNNFLNDMQRNLNSLQTLQQQMTSGKEIRKPSDDPFKSARIMQLYSDISANTQFNSNISDMKNWEDTTDTALNDAEEVLKRVNELLVSAGDAAYDSDEMKAIKDEINEKTGELSQILNTNFNGEYIFGGTRVYTKPTSFQTDAEGNTQLTYYNVTDSDGNADTNEMSKLKSKMEVEVSTGVTMEYNACSTDIINFKNSDGTSNDIISLLRNITANLDGNTVSSTAVDSSTITNPLTYTLDLGGDTTLSADMNISKDMFLTNGMTVGSSDMTIPTGGTMTLGGDMTIKQGTSTGITYVDSNGTTHNVTAADITAGDVRIPSGSKISAGEVIPTGTAIPAGTTVPTGTTIPSGTVLRNGTSIPAGTTIPGGTTIPAGTITINADGNADLQTSARDAITGSDLQGIKDALNNILSVRASVGAKENRMDTAKTRNEAENDNMKAVLSSTEDIDITEKTMQYATMQTVYMASLQTSAKVIQPTLLDYLS